PQASGEGVGLEVGQADGGVDRLTEDLLRRLLGNRLDLHPPFGGGHDDVPAHGPIEQDRQVELAGDVDALFDIEAVDLLALVAGLDRDEGRAEHLRRQFADFGGGGFRPPLDPGGDNVDAADVWMFLEGALAAPTGVDL